MSACSRLPQYGAVLAGIKATPFGWPPASLDPGCGRRTPAATGSAAEAGIRQIQVSTVSGDWLRLYEQHANRPEGEQALWLTRRAPVRPLTYSAARRMLQRANAALGTGWTLHDLRHTAAQRMVDDPSLSLTDVQWVLGHANITTTQTYLRPREEEVIGRVLAHHRDRGERPAPPPMPVDRAGYSPEVLALLFGGRAS